MCDKSVSVHLSFVMNFVSTYDAEALDLPIDIVATCYCQLIHISLNHLDCLEPDAGSVL